MERSQLKEQAIALQKQGYSLQQIADELNSSKSSIHRLLKGEGNNPLLSDETDETDEWDDAETSRNVPEHPIENFKTQKQINNMENQKNNDANIHYYKLQERQLELEHEREMQKMRQRDRELELERQKIASQQKTIRDAQKQEKEKLERARRALLKKFHRLVEELKENCESEYCWEYSDIEDFSERVTKFKEHLEDFIGSNTDDNYEDYLVWEKLCEMEEFTQNILDEGEGEEEVEITLNKKQESYIDELLEIESLDGKAKEDEEEENNNEEEEEAEDEE